jgi:hypothetical protein
MHEFLQQRISDVISKDDRVTLGKMLRSYKGIFAAFSSLGTFNRNA